MSKTYSVPLGGRQLLDLQLELECIRVENGNVLVPFSCPNPDPPPRLLVARYDGITTMLFRCDLPSHVREELAQLSGDSPDRLFDDEQAVKSILALDAPCKAMWQGRAYVVATTFAPDAYADTVRFQNSNEIGTAIFGVIRDDCVVSACSSSRENDTSAEAWVWTDPEYRGRGYAPQSVAACADDLHDRGKVPFYSHHIDNLASQSVAGKLKLKHFLAAAGYI